MAGQRSGEILVYALQQRVTPVLQGVGLELTNHCNLRCSMCWSQQPKVYKPRKRGYITWSLYKRCVDELSKYSEHLGMRLSLCLNYGGESMLHPKYCMMLNYAAQKKQFNLRAITNATLLTPEIAETLMQCMHVTVSIHNNAETMKAYDKVAGLVKLRGKNTRPVIDGAIVQNEFNQKNLMDQLKRWTQILDDITVYPLQTELLKYADWEKPEGSTCTQPTYYMAILWNGDVYPCCHLFSTDFRGMGNVAESGVLDVWRGERYELLREGKLPDAPCKGCELI